jgi:hypothetical protein
MTQPKLTSAEFHILEEALNSDFIEVNIRLREGEYQYELSKVIANFQLSLHFPDVKDIVKKLYGEEPMNDVKLIRKIQTILKKMEKSNIIRILPKIRPWQLQRYALLSFKFIDSEKKRVSFATNEQIQEAQEKVKLIFTQEKKLEVHRNILKIRIYVLVLIIIFSYISIVWNAVQSKVDPIIFVALFSLSALCSILLGKALSQE